VSHVDPTSLLNARAIGDDATRHPSDTNGQPLTLAEAVDHEAIAYHAWGTPVGELLARHMERLAQLIRWTGATTPEEHDARMEVWDDDLRRRWEECGYAAGVEAGRREGRDAVFHEIQLLSRTGPVR
jgi:hypothetical protein